MSRKKNTSATVEQMAQSLLKSCVFDAKTQLKAAAKDWRKNNQGVHQLRISLRRTLACLDLFSEQLSVAKETRWLQKTLKELLKSAGKARDLDVLLARESLNRERLRFSCKRPGSVNARNAKNL